MDNVEIFVEHSMKTARVSCKHCTRNIRHCEFTRQLTGTFSGRRSDTSK